MVTFLFNKNRILTYQYIYMARISFQTTYYYFANIKSFAKKVV
jgi:hypothetical protein